MSNSLKEDIAASRLLRHDEDGEINNRTVDTEQINRGGIVDDRITGDYIQEHFSKINLEIEKLENDKIGSITQELSYLRQVLDYQNSKIEKLTSLVTDFLENRNQSGLINSLQVLQDSDHSQVQTADLVQAATQEQASESVPVTGNNENLASHQEALGGQTVHLDSNMDPQLHQVAAAAVQQAEEQAARAHAQSQNPNVNFEKYRKKIYLKRKEDSDQAPGIQVSLRDSKRPKITVDFLHNPMTVKEIYDEFTKGFRGQPPLCEMDARFGKHEWRGDSRSKESKRYQRRKKLCDAIKRGMKKYDKSAEEIIRYIEEFRGDKSLTWVMNGNLPPDLCV